MAWNTISGGGRRRTRFGVAATLVLCLAAGAVLSGCAGTAVGVGATAGVAAYQERGFEGAARDLKTQAAITELWFNFDHTFVVRLGLNVYEGRALLTGAVDDAKVRADAVRLAWKATAVKEVLNEIQVTDEGGPLVVARDTWVTAQLASRITFDETILAINYDIETVTGVVYLIGIAQNQAEVDRVTAHARTIPYVKKIISHVRVKGAS
ncbi:MAG: BON domain-containing protein [Rhodospirillales bacterium]|jgi:osmotically-inducible protein OsmY|nr:BON domain-containing protein [Rhodospirillales bacterium]MDP6883201.1 BON domain-containing protein [Rhodospirillales bacterium]